MGRASLPRGDVQQVASSRADNLLDRRLTEYGFLFNPFQYLEASNDPHLFEYIVADDLPQLAWNRISTLIFSPFGGGKTALRMYVTRDCWSRLGSNHPFPIHLLPQAQDLVAGSSIGIWRPLLRGMSKALVLALFHQPLRFLELPTNEWSRLLSLITPHLSRPLVHYSDMLDLPAAPESVDDRLFRVRQVLDRSYVMPSTSYHALDEVRRRVDLSVQRDKKIEQNQQPAKRTFSELAAFLREELSFSHLFVLVDSVDAYHPDVAPLGRIVDWLTDLFHEVDGSHRWNVSVKCFLPHLLETMLSTRLSGEDVAVHRLKWTAFQIVDLLRRRISVATKGQFDSLDALSDAGSRHIEEQIANSVQPQPREAIFLASEILRAHLARQNMQLSPLNRQEINDAISHYRPPLRGAQQW